MASPATVKQFTKQQERAIHAADVSVALAAGAGCGKTFVLTERFLASLDPARPGGPLRLDQLTAITFTERAAREMRERIADACAKRLHDAPEEHVEHWLRTLREIDSARISTIHSFCGSLLRSHAVEARLDPRFEVLDATAAETLLFELVDEELRGRLAARDEATLGLVVAYGLKTLREMVERLLGQRQAIDWEKWLAETPEALVARWAEFWRRETLPRVLKKVAESPAAAEILRILKDEMPSHAAMRERCELLRERLPLLAGARDPAVALAEIREAAKVQGGGGKKAWSGEEVYEAFSAAAKKLRDTIDKVKDQVAFDPEAALPAAENALNLLAVTRGVSEAYQRRKDELATLDFDDLLIRARDLLAGPRQKAMRRQLAAQTGLLLVDEFQDTDPLQVDLVRALCDGRVTAGKLFFVGDYKQSIYRFRGADPHVFRALREEIPAHGRLPLTLNFRSQPGVLDFVNALFCDELGPEYEPLEPHRCQVGPRPAVEFLWAEDPEEEAGDEEDGPDSPADEGDEDEGTPTVRRRRHEAEWIARRIRGMIDSGERLVWDDEASRAGTPAVRAVRPGDIAILFRAMTNVEYYEDALRRHGIDYYLVGGHAFYAQQEIFDVVNLLRSLAAACDDVSLAGVLRSPMFGILDETLYRLARRRGEGFLWDGLAAAAAGKVDGLDAEQQARVEFAAATLAELRSEKGRMPMAQLLDKAMTRTGYDALLLSEFLGERKLANLRKLVDQARQFDASGIFTLADFITQLAQFVARQPDEPMAAMQAESVNAVRLMSVHQSKGLEFPVVFVADIDRPRRPSNNMAAFHAEMGPLVKLSGCTSGYDLFVQAESDEEIAELGRLLYVAATRAKDYLVLSAGVDDLEKTRGPWMELLKRRFDPLTGKRLQSPQDALAKATREEPPLDGKEATIVRHDLAKAVETAKELAAKGKGDVPVLLPNVDVETGARRQYSFSRLRGSLHRQPPPPPSGGEDGPPARAAAIDPIGLGTLVHDVLAELPRRDDDSAAAIEELVCKHARRQSADSEELQQEAIGLVGGLCAAPRWAAIREAARQGAENVLVELEFLLAWPPDGVAPDAPYIQGFIDCLYRDAVGGWHLVDYKTNRVSDGDLAATVENYKMQMLVYALAVERVLGAAPVEIVLHFLRSGRKAPFEWNPAARMGCREQVGEALRRQETGQK